LATIPFLVANFFNCLGRQVSQENTNIHLKRPFEFGKKAPGCASSDRCGYPTAWTSGGV